MDVAMPDGTVVAGVPDGITQSQLLARYNQFNSNAQSFGSRVGSDLASRQQEAGDIGSDYASGKLNMAGALAKTAGTGLGALTDIAGEAAKSGWNALPSAVTKPVESGLSALKEDFAQTPEGVALSLAYPAAKEEAAQMAEQYPNMAAGANLAGNVAKALPIASGVEGIANLAKEAAPDLMTAAKKTSPLELLKNEASGSPDIEPTSPSAPRKYFDIKSANQALSDNTSATYAMAHDLGAVFTPEANEFAINKIQQDVGKLYDKLHTQTSGAMNYFLDQADENGLNLQNLDDARKKFNLIAYDSTANANDIAASKKAIKSIDGILDAAQENPDMLANGTPDAVAALKAAREASALEQRHNTITDILRRANGNPNKIQVEFKKLFDDEDEFNRFSPQDQNLIETIAHPGKMMNALQLTGKLGAGAGSSAAIPAELVAGLLGHPIAGGAAFAAGTGANLTRNYLIRRGADQVLRNIEGMSKPASAISTPFRDAEYEAALARANNPPAKPLMLPAPQTTNIVNPSGQIVPMTPAVREILGQSPSTIAEQTPADVLRAKEAAANSQSELLRELGTKRIKDYEDTGFKRGGVVQPTEAQKHAGNYKKEKITLHGLPISIETPKGAIRSGKDKDGKEWTVKMPVSYGYIRKTEAKDGEHVDCFVGPNKHSLRVYVIDQKKDDGSYDECKVMLGFPTREAALDAYRSSYSDKKNRIMHVRKMLMPQFKEWLKTGDTKKPIKNAA